MIFLPVLLLLTIGASVIYICSRPVAKLSKKKALLFFDGAVVFTLVVLCVIHFFYFSYGFLAPLLGSPLILFPAALLRKLLFR